MQLSDNVAEDDDGHARHIQENRAWSSSSEDEQPASKNRSSLGRISEEVERVEADAEADEADSTSRTDVPSTPLRGASPSHAKSDPSSRPGAAGQKVQPTPPATTVLTSMIKSALSSAAGQPLSASLASPGANAGVQDQSPRLWQRKTWLSTPSTSPISRRARSRSSSDLLHPTRGKVNSQDEGAVLGNLAASTSTADLGRLMQSRWSSSTSNWDLSDSHAGFQLRSDLSRELALGRSPNRPGELVDISSSREQEQSLDGEDGDEAQSTRASPEHGTKASSQLAVEPSHFENHLSRSHFSSITPSITGSMAGSEASAGYPAARRYSSDDYQVSSVQPLGSLASRKSTESGDRRSMDGPTIDRPLSTHTLSAANDELDDSRQSSLSTPCKRHDPSCRASSPTDTVELLGRFPSVPIDGQNSSSIRVNATPAAASAADPATASITTPTSWLGRKMVKAASAVSARRSSEPGDTLTSPGLAAAMQIGSDGQSANQAGSFDTASDRDSMRGAAAKSAVKGSRLLDIIRKDGARRTKAKASMRRGSGEAATDQSEPSTSPTTTAADVTHQAQPQSASMGAAAACLTTPASYESLLDGPFSGQSRRRATSRASCTCTDANEEFRSARGSIHVEDPDREIALGRQSVEHYQQLPSLDLTETQEQSSESGTRSSHLVESSPAGGDAQSEPRTSCLTHRSSTNSCYGLRAERKNGSAISEHSKDSRSNSPAFTKSSLDSLRSATRSRVQAVKGSKVLLAVAKRDEKQSMPSRGSKAASPNISPFMRATSLRGLRERFGAGHKPATLSSNDQTESVAPSPDRSPAACSSATVVLTPHAACDDIMSPQTSRLHDLGRGLGLGLNQSTTSLLQDIVEASKSPPSAAFPRSSSVAGLNAVSTGGGRILRGGAASDVGSATSQDPQDWTPDKRHAFRKWLEAEGKGRGYFSPGGGSGTREG